MTDRDPHPVDDLLQDLTRALDVDPPPEFAARVRARLDETPARWASAWLPAVAVAAVAILAVSAAWWGRERGAAPASDVAPVQSPPVEVIAQAGETTSAASGVADAAGPRRNVAVGPGRVVTVGPRPGGAAGLQPRGREPVFEVLVPPDQRRLLERLLADLHEGRVAIEPGGPAIDEATGALVPPPAIEIPPIVVSALPGTPGRIGEGSTHR